MKILNPLQVYQDLLQRPKIKWLVVALTIIYFVSPIDIIPEFIFPFGYLDDSAILIAMITGLLRK
jgi:uncharacterized membrane protein YkvA (DUF1232 family)